MLFESLQQSSLLKISTEQLPVLLHKLSHNLIEQKLMIQVIEIDQLLQDTEEELTD